VPDASRTIPPHNPRLHPARKRLPFQADKYCIIRPLPTTGSKGKFAPVYRGSFCGTKTQTCFLSAIEKK